MTSHSSMGSLYIVATPIGNLEDISQRMSQTLSMVDIILAEDTRQTGFLLNHLGIKKNTWSFHAHNEANKTEAVIHALIEGKNIALVSDAGTPLISDPGFSLVREAQQRKIKVIPIPGPCALITALSASGISCDKFQFWGFLPAKQQARITALETIHSQSITTIIYESTHRIMDLIKDIISVFGPEHNITLAKELTKLHEQILNSNVNQVKNWLEDDKLRQKGEFVVIISPAIKHENNHELLIQTLLKHLPLKQAVTIAVELTGASKNLLYDMALKIVQ
jgi:16S rRNA (cytidine1402-2'-O)-methyltransferase